MSELSRANDASLDRYEKLLLLKTHCLKKDKLAYV